MKQCLNFKKFYTFIKICCNDKNVTPIVIIEMFDRYLCNQFIRLCTGECGPSYKGSSYKKGTDKDNSLVSILRVEKFIENDCETKSGRLNINIVEYNITNQFQHKNEEMFLYLNYDGSFEIYRPTGKSAVSRSHIRIVDFWAHQRSILNSSTSGYPFGRIISPTKLFECISYEDPSYLKVIDAGIILNI
ncbi:hypothetical protein Avbf_02197 [Armadillidium vulgare]|nr:hypothetical protein Avbf_02197 [Armadillidium vulgare]